MKVSPMFRRYYESHGPQHMKCPKPEEIEKDFDELKRAGLPDNDAYRLMALRGAGAMATVNTSGGGRLPAFLRLLRRRGFKVYS